MPGNAWNANINGTAGQFMETISGCTLTESGMFLCDQPVVGHFISAPH
jgi:hypothetical protein